MSDSDQEIPIPAGLIEDTLEHTKRILSPQFAQDAFQRYIVADALKLPETTQEITVEQNNEVFGIVVPDLLSKGGRMITLAGSGIATVWKLETLTSEPPTPGAEDPAGVSELNKLAHPARLSVLSPGRRVLHLILLANDKSAASMDQAPSSSAVVKPVLEMAEQRGWPVCLEATSPRSRDVYKYWGFKDLGEVKVGKGVVDGEGRKDRDGEGVSLWVMVWGS